PDRGLSRKHLLEGLRGSLRRLQLDYVDVVFAGPRPGPAHNEGLDPTLRLLRLEELVRAMSDVIEQGLALYWGTAGVAPGDVMDTFAVARQLNLVAPVCQWAELPPEPRLFRHLGLGAVTWSPMAPGPPMDEETPGNAPAKGRPRCPVALGELQPLAQRLGCSERQLGIGEGTLGTLGTSGTLGTLGTLGTVGTLGDIGDIGDTGGHWGTMGTLGDIGDTGDSGDIGDIGDIGDTSGDIGEWVTLW
ncbi:hypothetical protein HGM15179_018815, partial [Zosterops borbonicus]